MQNPRLTVEIFWGSREGLLLSNYISEVSAYFFSPKLHALAQTLQSAKSRREQCWRFIFLPPDFKENYFGQVFKFPLYSPLLHKSESTSFSVDFFQL